MSFCLGKSANKQKSAAYQMRAFWENIRRLSLQYSPKTKSHIDSLLSFGLIHSDIPLTMLLLEIISASSSVTRILERLSMTLTVKKGKNETFELPSVFSSLYSRIRVFVFIVNSKRHVFIFV